MINIGCASPTGLSYCYLSIDALGFGEFKPTE